jgi:hypothetical protein
MRCCASPWGKRALPKRFTVLFAVAILTSVSGQAQSPEEGRSLWDHNGSVMYLVANGSSRDIYYQKPRPGMLEAGAHPDSLLFKGEINDGQISGIAYIFNSQCGQLPFHVKGPVLDNTGKIVLTGQAPQVGRNCQSIGEYISTLEFKLLKTSEVAQPPLATAQTPNVEAPTPEPSPSDAPEDKLSNSPSAQPTRSRQTPWVTDPWPMAPSSGVVASKMPGNSVVLALTPEQPPSIQESRSEAGEAQGFMNKNRLATLIIALNVALPLFSILFLVKVLRSSEWATPRIRSQTKPEGVRRVAGT